MQDEQHRDARGDHHDRLAQGVEARYAARTAVTAFLTPVSTYADVR